MSFFFYNYIITPFTKSVLFLVTSFLFFPGREVLVLVNIFSGAYSVQGVGKHMTFCFVPYPFSNNLQYFEYCIGIFMEQSVIQTSFIPEL